MSIIIDLNAVCLVCLQQNDTLRNVYAPDDQNPELQIAYKIGRCSDLKLDQENRKIPHKICNVCLMDLKVAWRFRQNCDTAQVIFRTILHDQQQEAENTLSIKQVENKAIKTPQELKVKRVHQLQRIKKDTLISTKLKNQSEGLEENHQFNNKHLTKKSEKNQQNKTFTVEKTKNEDIVPKSSGVQPNQTDEQFECFIPEEITPDSSTNNDVIATHEQVDENMIKFKKADEKTNVKVSNSPGRKLRITVTSKDNVKHTTDEIVTLKQEVPEQVSPLYNSKLRTRHRKSESITSETLEEESANDSEDDKPRDSEHQQLVRTKKRKSTSGDEKPLKICEICGNSYRYQHALNAHMRRHNDDRQFPCEFCDKAFVSNVELRRHIRVHTGQKPYQCQYCDRRFSDFGSRIKHERTHTGERPYHCPTCGKTFGYAHVLSVHMRTHTGEKKFRCELCGKGVTKKSYLLAHLNRHTKENEMVNSDFLSIKSVALEECILTTEYIDEDEDGNAEIRVLVTGESFPEKELSLNIA